MTASVSRQQRHLRRHPCPVCGGFDEAPRGQEKRCHGFTSDDGMWSHCAREEMAGSIVQGNDGLFVHKMQGSCKCGTVHREDTRPRDEVEATYDYFDEHGILAFQVVRKIGKRFLQRRPDGHGGWLWDLHGTTRTLYRLPELLDQDNADRVVYVVEGEKDVDSLVRRGFVATTNPGGAGKWHTVGEIGRRVLQDRDVIVVADADEPGRKHARQVEASIRDVVRSLKVLEPPAPYKDATALLQAGKSLDDLVALDDEQAPPALESATEEPKAPAFAIWTPGEIWKPLEPPDYLMEGLFVRGSLALIVAYGSSLKTWVLEDGAIAVSVGGKWLGRFETTKAKALIIDFESGDYELRRRAHRIARGRELAIPIEGFAFVTMPSLSLVNDEFFAALEPLAKEYGFIGIDSLAAGSGGIDENDARFATSLQRLKAIAARTGSVIVVLHHTRKGGGEESDQREMVRGSSAIFNACDIVLMMARSKDDAFVVRQTKARGGKAVEPFIVRVEDTGPDASLVVASNAPDSDDGECLSKAKAIDKAKRAIVLLLGTERSLTSKRQVWDRIGGSKGDKVKALAELIESGLVVEHEGTFRLASEVSR